MFSQLLHRDGFAGVWGLTTAERRHACYNYSWDKECGRSPNMVSCGNSSHKHSSNRNTWNANSWPYETSRVITALSRVLHNDAYKDVVADKATGANVNTFYRAHYTSDYTIYIHSDLTYLSCVPQIFCCNMHGSIRRLLQLTRILGRTHASARICIQIWATGTHAIGARRVEW